MDSDTNEGFVEDRISQLPDALLYEILSYLPTKNIVATCILSTRWNKLTPFAVSPNQLVLDDSQLLHPENDSFSTTFMHFVDKLLNDMLINELCVPYVIIRCRKQYGDAKFLSWLRSVVQMNVENLLLNFGLTESECWFRGLSGCKTLTRLELGGKSSVCPPYEFRLPNLKSLRLCGIIFDEADDAFFMNLMIWFPLLLNLHVSECDFQHMIIICIQSLSLKNLFIENSWDETSYDFTLVAPSLEVFLLKYRSVNKFYICPLSCFTCAVIDVGSIKLMEDDDDDEEEENGLMGVLTACFTASRLYLNRGAIEAFDEYPYYQLPILHNLTTLSLGRMQSLSGWALLACLLCTAPNLKTLAFREGFNKCEHGYRIFERCVSTAPHCLESHLKGIDIQVSDEEEDEIQLIEYFLKNGKVLEKIRINCFAVSNRDWLDRLQGLPEGSKIQLLLKWDAGLFDPQISTFNW